MRQPSNNKQPSESLNQNQVPSSRFHTYFRDAGEEDPYPNDKRCLHAMKLHGHDLVLRLVFFHLFDSVRRQKFDGVRPFLLSRRQTSKRDVVREGAIDRAHRSKALAWIRLPEIPGQLVVVDDGPVHRIIVDGYSPVRLQMIGHRFVELDQACLSACWPTSDE